MHGRSLILAFGSFSTWDRYFINNAPVGGGMGTQYSNGWLSEGSLQDGPHNYGVTMVVQTPGGPEMNF